MREMLCARINGKNMIPDEGASVQSKLILSQCLLATKTKTKTKQNFIDYKYK